MAKLHVLPTKSVMVLYFYNKKSAPLLSLPWLSSSVASVWPTGLGLPGQVLLYKAEQSTFIKSKIPE